MTLSHTPHRALMVVAKQPAPGQTKTRLCPPLSGEQAAALYECFLSDTLDIIRAARQQISFDPILVYLPLGSQTYFRTLAPDFGLLLQNGIDLSERLNHATSHCLKNLGYQQVLIMDSDSPTLPTSSLVEAFTALDTADVSLGSCDDGGYYLIGTKKSTPSLFLKVTMSTDHVTADTLVQAKEAGLQVTMLPASYDIDYVADLKRLALDLTTQPAHVAAHTRTFLANHPGILED
ncbi:MAG: TIGR04282 family arsenosugar biosynthesis glycosyltransferase [Anaerolineae bacterium]|nr:TIGR04282 family arsenosugar biosynthesis glycosyltransferase [Anaerolineae bacterium]